MNISTSECSSGCESGWTTYLDHLSNSTNPNNRKSCQGKGANVNQEDEDLSMVSDASSGPPHLHENDDANPQCYAPFQEGNKKSKQKMKTKEKQMHNVCLDDTASSPVLHFSKGNAVQYSTEHFSQVQEEGTPKQNIAFLKSSMKGKSGSFLGRKRQSEADK